ncbi:MAG: RNase adapter RapZ [Pseudomonadota bacterium]|nr:RNase adapter RapZ [Pseudomonadota bacterium]
MGDDHLNDDRQRLILVTGASGAGLSTALDILEDSGINAVDNLPLAMIDTLVALEVETGRRSLAMGLDARTTGFSAETTETLVRNLRKKFGDRFTTVFITASHDDLLRRFNATRRQHPLHDGAMSLADAISADLDRMEKVAPLADLHIDTSGAKPSDLRQALLSKLGMADDFQVNVRLISFSYRRRIPDHSDLVIDMRFADNPYWVTELRSFDGRDEPVAAFLQADEAASSVVSSLKGILAEMLPRMTREGRPLMTIAFGCTGGRHRSVWAVETVAAWLAAEGYDVESTHRELEATH